VKSLLRANGTATVSLQKKSELAAQPFGDGTGEGIVPSVRVMKDGPREGTSWGDTSREKGMGHPVR